jgi:hypothetical protein
MAPPTPCPTLLVGFASVDAAILTLSDGGFDVRGSTFDASPGSLSWQPATKEHLRRREAPPPDSGQLLLVDARTWDATQWKDADETVVTHARAGRVELYVLVDSICRVPPVLRPYFVHVVCSQRACAALAALAGEDSLWLDFDTMKFSTRYSRTPVPGAREGDACSQQ